MRILSVPLSDDVSMWMVTLPYLYTEGTHIRWFLLRERAVGQKLRQTGTKTVKEYLSNRYTRRLGKGKKDKNMSRLQLK